MAIDYNLILGGQAPDIVGSMSRGNALAGQVMQQDQARQTRDLYKTQGAGISMGDPAALNALAQLDPAASMDLRATKQRMDIMSAEEQRAIQDFATKATAQQKAEAVQKIEEAVKMGTAIQDPQTWDQVMSQQAPELVGQFGMRDALARKYMTMAEAIKVGQGGSINDAPAQFLSLHMQAEAAGYKAGTPEYKNFMGTAGAGVKEAAKIGAKLNAEQVARASAAIPRASQALTYIDSIRNHKGREAGTGASAWTANIYGTNARDFRAEVDRLKGGAFLEAIQFLQGMGALSNAEGQTATAAMAALDLEGTEEGFLKRLKEYEDIVKAGQAKALRILAGQDDPLPIEGQTESGGVTPELSDDDLLKMYGGE